MSLILCTPRHCFLPTGLTPVTDEQFESLFAAAIFHERDKAEHDERVWQFISYVLVQHKDRYFVYQRSSKGDEARLHQKFAIGVGGHVEAQDQSYGDSAVDIFWNSVRRELKEELDFTIDKTPELIGVLYDSGDSQGRVHLGIVLRIVVEEMDFAGERDILVNREFKALDALSTMPGLESWSRICVQYLQGGLDWYHVHGIYQENGIHVQSPRKVYHNFNDDRAFQTTAGARQRMEELRERFDFCTVSVSPVKIP